MSKYNAYVINLDGSIERLAKAASQLDHAGIDYERVAAIDGRQLNLAEIDDYDSEKAIRYMGRPLNGGEIGCYRSHLKALNTFLDSDAKYALILEDDLLLLPDFKNKFEMLIDWLDTDERNWDILHISSNEKKYCTRIAKIFEHNLLQSHYFPMVTTGLIWTRSGAQSFIDYHTIIFAPYDNALRDWQSFENKSLTVQPPLIIPSGAASDIDGHTKARKKERNSLILYGLRKQKRTITLKLRALRNKYGV